MNTCVCKLFLSVTSTNKAVIFSPFLVCPAKYSSASNSPTKKMTTNLLVHEISPESSNWTCKIQIVDICGPGESKEKRVKYFNMIAQDEQEDQIKIIVYGDDIPAFQKKMKLYHTYRITTARLQPPSLKYEKPVGAFDWVLDKRNIIDSVEKDDVDALPLPTKLNVSSFEDIKHRVIEPTMTNMSYNEFDILATVVNCSSPRYVASVEKRLQELIVMDMFKETLTFTIWEEAIIEDQGKKLLHQFHRYPVILARRVGASKYNGASLTTKFNTTIQIDPPYPQCQQLQEWVSEKKELLTSFTLRSTSRSGFLISVPLNEQIVPIANIESQQDGQTFPIEAKITLPTDLKKFYVLICSNCGQEVRYPIIREIDCMNCDQKKMLTPRCKFEINLKDKSASTIGMIMDKEAEKLLSLTAEEIYERATHPGDYPPVEDLQTSISKKLFCVRAKKAFARTSHTTSAKLYIQSCVEKGTINIQEGTKRKQKVQAAQPSEEAESLKMKQKLEPPTPQKNN